MTDEPIAPEPQAPQQEAPVATQATESTVQQTVKTVTKGPQDQASAFTVRNEWSRIITGWIVILGFISAFVGMILKYDFVTVKDILMIMIGVLCAKFSTVIDFDFGGSASSNAKTNIMANKP